MWSGIEFREHEHRNRDLNRLWVDMVIGTEKGTIASIVQFNTRVAPPGTGFFYASIEADVLGLVLRSATGSRRLLACGFTRCRSRARILQRRSPGLRSVGATARQRRAMGRATAGTTAQARRCDHRE